MSRINGEKTTTQVVFKEHQKIKPCPFCGFSEVSASCQVDGYTKLWVVYCEFCNAMAPGDVGVICEDDAEMIRKAIARWNRRTPECKPL